MAMRRLLIILPGTAGTARGGRLHDGPGRDQSSRQDDEARFSSGRRQPAAPPGVAPGSVAGVRRGRALHRRAARLQRPGRRIRADRRRAEVRANFPAVITRRPSPAAARRSRRPTVRTVPTALAAARRRRQPGHGASDHVLDYGQAGFFLAREAVPLAAAQRRAPYLFFFFFFFFFFFLANAIDWPAP